MAVSQASIVESIIDVDQKLKAITLGKEKFARCMLELQRIESHIESIDTYIDPVKSKIEQVLAFTEEIQSDTNKIEQVAELEEALNTFQLPGMREFMLKLAENQTSLLESAQEAMQMELETAELMNQTNDFFSKALDSVRQMNVKIEEHENKMDRKNDCNV